MIMTVRVNSNFKRHLISELINYFFLGEVCNFYFTIVKNYGNLWINGEPDVIEDGEEKETNQDCEGTVCPGGCCPNAGWFCCPGDEYCAASEEYCKKTNFAQKMISMAVKLQ